ncbi:hypothetical protein WMF20_15535 [Sorangium sp. So ce834]|uniref:restriction endonuclease subunit S n=1 Tax=Sorangium sp. So ce834 TaxID=3133321 RepID=UPI003F643243
MRSVVAPTYRLALRMPTPRQVLDLLSRNELLALADAHRLIVVDRRVKAHIADRIEMTGPPIPELLAMRYELLQEAPVNTQGTADLPNACERARREIDLLREYRTRLIADVITGQLDVRDAAARLPASDPDEPAAADLDDDATDDDLDEGEPE